jgi:SNF2 family DNA or RNA helicase
MLSYKNLHEYQLEGIEYIQSKPKCYLAMDIGLGKTVITLTAINELLKSGEITSVMVIAPLRVVTNVWMQEAKQWEHLQHLTFSLVRGDRQAAIDKKADIYLMNPEGLLWVRDKGIKNLPGDMLVIDEASMFKDSSTQRFKVIKKHLHGYKRTVCLSGTPAPNSLLNLWPAYFILDQGKRLFPTFGKYKHTCFEQADYFGYSWKIKHGMEKLIYQRVGDITLRMDKKAYLELPETVEIDMRFDLPEKARQQYEDLEKDMFLELDEGNIVAANAVALTSKCRQFTQGVVYDEDGACTIFHKAKIEVLQEIIEESEGDPIMVAYSFRSEVALLKKAFPDAPFINGATGDIDHIIQDWNDRKIPLLFVQPQSISHGLNMQFGGNILVWYAMDYSYERYVQLCGRLERQGQTKSVKIIRIIANNTVDEMIKEALTSKADTQNKFLDALTHYRGTKQ